MSIAVSGQKRQRRHRLNTRCPRAIAAVGSLALALSACAGDAGNANQADGGQSEAYPEGKIELIVPFSPGGSTDLAARVLAKALEAKWEVPVSVINQEGGNTIPALHRLVEAEPDGYTMYVENQNSSSMLDLVVEDVPGTLEERTNVAIAGGTRMMFIVNKNSQFETLQDVADYAQRPSTKLSWTSLGGSGTQDLAFMQLFESIGIDIAETRPVAMPGGSDAVTAVAGGHVDIGVGSWSGTQSAFDAGLVRVLAVASDKEFFAVPDAPTTVEAGFPDIQALYWIGFSGPPELPSGIVDKWNSALAEILVDESIVSELTKIGVEPFYEPKEEMNAFIEEEKSEISKLFGS